MALSLSPFTTVPLSPARVPDAPVPGLYVHIPFCFHKCHYCDFYSITRQTDDRMAGFVNLLLREADLWTAPRPGPTPQPRTIFFGGGTPSLLPLPLMQQLIAGLRDRFNLSHLTEWTVECNPATASLEYLHMLREAGVDRISFGAQSFDRAELKTLERHHDPDDVPRSLDWARQAGFTRLNLDLIFAIPGQSLASWQRSLNTALGLGTTHLSCYGLTYESNTPMTVRKRLGHFASVDESVELGMFHHTRAALRSADMPAYEVSNFAAPGQACRHNLLYWQGDNYIGLGPSAASHVQGWRWKNRPHLGEWERAIDSHHLPTADVETLQPLQRAAELAMFRLRLTDGLRFTDFTDRTGYDARTLYASQIEHLTRLGLLDVDDTRLCLTERGWDVTDSVAAEFASPLD